MGPISQGIALAAGLALAALVCSGSGSIAASSLRHRAHVVHQFHHHHNHHYHRLPHRPQVVLDHSAPPHEPHHPRVVTFVDGYVQPEIPHPYPFDGKLAGDGILRTGILDSAALRAYGIVRN